MSDVPEFFVSDEDHDRIVAELKAQLSMTNSNWPHEKGLHETIARQARAIEILKNCILKEDHRCGIWREGREALELAAIEQGEGK